MVKPEGGITPRRAVQLVARDFFGIVSGATVGTLKSQKKPFIVPEGRFWFPLEFFMYLKVGGAITTEDYVVGILAPDGDFRTMLVLEIAVTPNGPVLWPIRDARTGPSYFREPLVPVMMVAGERFQMLVTSAVNGDLWEGRGTYLEIIARDAERAYDLYYQFTRGTREMTERIVERP